MLANACSSSGLTPVIIIIGGMVICGEEASYYDEHQYCRCEEGQSMSYIESEHDDDHEDRTWKFKCQLIPGTKKDTPIETRDSSRDGCIKEFKKRK